MMEHYIVNNLQNLILLLIGIYIFYSAWQDWLTSYLRQKVFEVRDYLFLQAADKKIDFQSKEYVIIRNFLNGTIRFSHRLTWLNLIYYYYLFNKFGLVDEVKRNKEIDVENAINNIKNHELKIELRQKMDNITTMLILTIYLKSPLLIFVTLVLIPILIFTRFLRELRIREITQRQMEFVIEGDMLINPV